MASNKSKNQGGLTEVAQSIGSKLGSVTARANRMIEGVKAAAEAGVKTYRAKPGDAKTSRSKSSAKKKSSRKKT